jgi:hypothetical protein
MIMIIEYTTYPILASSTVAMVHPPRGSYEEMLRPSNNLQPVQSTYDRTNDEMMDHTYSCDV